MVTNPPSIAVDFVSAERRDWLGEYQRRRQEFLAAGVKEYWVVDRFRRLMDVYFGSMHGSTGCVLTEGDTIRTELLPGFELSLNELLAQMNEGENES